MQNSNEKFGEKRFVFFDTNVEGKNNSVETEKATVTEAPPGIQKSKLTEEKKDKIAKKSEVLSQKLEEMTSEEKENEAFLNEMSEIKGLLAEVEEKLDKGVKPEDLRAMMDANEAAEKKLEELRYFGKEDFSEKLPENLSENLKGLSLTEKGLSLNDPKVGIIKIPENNNTKFIAINNELIINGKAGTVVLSIDEYPDIKTIKVESVGGEKLFILNVDKNGNGTRESNGRITEVANGKVKKNSERASKRKELDQEETEELEFDMETYLGSIDFSEKLPESYKDKFSLSDKGLILKLASNEEIEGVGIMAIPEDNNTEFRDIGENKLLLSGKAGAVIVKLKTKGLDNSVSIENFDGEEKFRFDLDGNGDGTRTDTVDGEKIIVELKGGKKVEEEPERMVRNNDNESKNNKIKQI